MQIESKLIMRNWKEKKTVFSVIENFYNGTTNNEDILWKFQKKQDVSCIRKIIFILPRRFVWQLLCYIIKKKKWNAHKCRH